MSTQPGDYDEDNLASSASNALLYEIDRLDGTMNGIPIPEGFVTGTALDRDFYARTLAAEMGSSPERLKAALTAVQARPPAQPRAADTAERRYAASIGIDPNDDAAVIASWRRAWNEMAENLTTRALLVIETTNGPVKAPNALEAMGILPTEDD